jgi:hypothetical protein
MMFLLPEGGSYQTGLRAAEEKFPPQVANGKPESGAERVSVSMSLIVLFSDEEHVEILVAGDR